MRLPSLPGPSEVITVVEGLREGTAWRGGDRGGRGRGARRLV